MKRNHLLSTLAPAMLLLAATLGTTGCTNDDDLGRLPQGSIPLTVGGVSVAGVQTAHTRVAIEENPATGYTGIRKSRFVAGDELTLTLKHSEAAQEQAIATLDADGKWVIEPAGVFLQPSTTLTATHTATAQATDISADHLKAESVDCPVANGKVTITMKHAGAMIDITLPADIDPAAIDLTTITLGANNGTADETLATIAEEEADASMHYRTIAAAPGTVKSITAVIHGQSYVAMLSPALTVEANKKYPVSLTFKEGKLTASVGAASLDWGVGGTTDVVPAGYTHVIRTPEDLAQFAKEMNERGNTTDVIAIQTADIDLALLMPPAEAMAARPGKTYNYTVTKDNWVPIGGIDSNPFKGKYNGNGHTISNLTITSGTACGLFGSISGSRITGVHLRNFSATVSGGGGALAYMAAGGSISLCSATGTVQTGGGVTGGFVGALQSAYVTRCTADVDVSLTGASAQALGSFTGRAVSASVIAGCSSTGKVAWGSGTGTIAGFIGYLQGRAFGCYYGGSMENTTTYNAFSGSNGESVINSCYATAEGKEFCSMGSIADCAYAGATTLGTVTGNITDPQDAYAVLTATNASLSKTYAKTLHWSPDDGYTLTEVNEPWYAVDVWQDNATATTPPTIDLTYEGWDGKYEGQTPSELAIAGQTAYWVSPVDAQNANGQVAMNWTDALTACPKNWHLPTKDEFVAMTGLTADGNAHPDNYADISSVFPAGVHYWSSTGSGSSANHMGVNTNNTSGIYSITKTTAYRVRCVRRK